MKNIVIIFTLITALFMSCDGRQSQRESLQNALNDFNKKQTSIDVIKYHPKEYTEIVTDTIISNTLEVKIKNYTLMDKQIPLISKSNEVHRAFESEVEVFASSTSVFKTIINAELFATQKDTPFWNNATLEHVWVNQDLSTAKEVFMDVSFLNPITKDFKLYRMSVDVSGKHQIHLIEETT
jgi:hypothetical protein